MNGYFRSYVRVNLSAIAHNINEVRKKIPQGTKILAVIKTQAYGHGAVAVAKSLHESVDYFAVAFLDEAIELRNAGITKPILILGYTSCKEADLLVRYDISQTVYSLELARAVSDAAVRQSKTGRLHIAVDTGMSRIGYQCNEQSIAQILQMNELPNLLIEGIFTHFACADMADKSYSRMQMQRFDDFVQCLYKEGIRIPLVHMSNSAAVMAFEDHHFDMVRSGIITYGLWPSEEVDKTVLKLQPALEWKAHVINVAIVPEGTGISYGASYVTKKPMRIATVSAGYGDGYPRSLSSKGRVLIHGRYADIVGRVCMDQMMVDISQIEDVQIEDEVTLVGRDGGECITVEELAQLSGRFNYEFVCDISNRVARIYQS